MRRSLWLVWTSAFLLLSSHGVFAEEILELSRSFIEKYKNKLTIDVMYLVDAAHRGPIRRARTATCMWLAGQQRSGWLLWRKSRTPRMYPTP